MTNYIMITVDDIEVNTTQDRTSITFKDEKGRASIHLTDEMIEKTIAFLQAEQKRKGSGE